MTKKNSLARIPSLDGIRAVAILLTIAHHMFERYITVTPSPVINAFNRSADGIGVMFVPDKAAMLHNAVENYALRIANPIIDSFNRSGDGVGIFFVLSGFLITTLLLKEYEQAGKVKLFDFYLRRTFRILPPLYAYIIFFVVFCSYKGLETNWSALQSAVFFYLDYSVHAGFWAVQHTWSLCVEEQFYLLWPLIFLLALYWGGKPAAAKTAAALIVVTPLMRVATKYSNIPIFFHRENFMLHTRMDALMCGCLLALLTGRPIFETFYNWIAKYWWLMPFYTFFLSGFLNLVFGFTYTNSIGLTIDSLCIAFFILWASRNTGSVIGKILNTRVMVAAGILSYSAYIWQTFFIYFDQHATIEPWLCNWPIRFVLIWAAALTSYVVVEKPSLKLRIAMQNLIASWQGEREGGLAVRADADLETGDAGN